MTITVVGLVDSAREAESLVKDLTQHCRCDRSDISLTTLRGDNGRAQAAGGVAAGAMKGLVGGIVLGAIIGFVVSAASIAVPGFEDVIERGPAASIIVFAVVFAVLGIVIGALAGVERRSGEEAGGRTERRAGTLITIHAREDQEADCALNVLRHHGAREIDKRSSDWNKRDWGHYDEAPEPAPRVVPERTAEAAPRSYNRPMEEAATASAPEQAAPPGALNPIAPGIAAKEQAAIVADTSNWITRTYTATYFGPERRRAANQTPYQGAERRHSA
jgi:hypothetical protein